MLPLLPFDGILLTPSRGELQDAAMTMQYDEVHAATHINLTNVSCTHYVVQTQDKGFC